MTAPLPQSQPSTANATPTPWRVFTTPDGRKLVGIGDQEGQGILDCGFGVWSWNDAEGIANANLVVEAVNSHASLKARAEQAERSVDVLEAALRVIQAKTEGERHTVNEQNVFKYWGLLNLMMIEIRDIARAALSQSRDVARTPT